MKFFKNYTIDEQNDFNLFNEVSCDFNVITHFITSKLDGSRSSSQIEFHNNLINVRTILDKFIDILNYYENENTETTEESL